jgi:trans-aconitate 2-methyltransferase
MSFVITYARMSSAEDLRDGTAGPSGMRWRGSSYDRISGPQEAMGRAVVSRLELRGDETVLDAGCGSGRVSEALLERLPHGRVLALDASPSMLEAARGRLLGRAELARRVEVLQGDLLEVSPASLALQEPLDAVLSTATFHWISDHQRLFERLRALLRPGGQLVAQCGGEGNIDGVRGAAMEILARDPYAGHMGNWEAPWNYAGPAITEERLIDAGFTAARAWLEPSPQRPAEPREFLQTIVLAPHLQRLPPELHDPFLDELMETLGEPVTIDFVRLNLDASA